MIRSFLFILVLLLVGAAPAVAGGWALTEVTDMPAAFEAGPTHEVNYTILQHGKNPVDVDATWLTFTTGSETLQFPGKRVALGQYEATVTLPFSGTWDWSVHQGWFGDQPLGTLDVAPAGSIPSSGSALPVVLTIGAVLTAGVAMVQALASRRRPTPATHVG